MKTCNFCGSIDTEKNKCNNCGSTKNKKNWDSDCFKNSKEILKNHGVFKKIENS